MEIVGEIDTKSIESVQAALTLFGEKSDKWNRTSNGSNRESDKEKELEGVLKDIATYKVQLEAREAAHMQALLKLDYYHNTVSELSTAVRDLEIDRERHRDQCEEARIQVVDLELQLKKMSDQCSELLSMENALKMEKEKVEELLKRILELDESIVSLKSSAANAEKVKLDSLSQMDAEMEKLKSEISQLRNDIEEMKKANDELTLKLEQENERVFLSEKFSSGAIDDLKRLQGDLEAKEREATDQAFYTRALEMEINQLKEELGKANIEISDLKSDLENVYDCLKKMKIEMSEKEERENEMDIEIADLKYELHLGRSKMAGAEAAEVRAKSLEMEFSATLQKLALELEEAKKENSLWKEKLTRVDENEKTENAHFGNSFLLETSQAEEVDDNRNTISMEDYKSLIEQAYCESRDEMEKMKKEFEVQMVKLEEENKLLKEELSRLAEQTENSLLDNSLSPETKEEKKKNESQDTSVTISMEEYKLIEKAERENKDEMERVKKELEASMAKIGEFRTRAEQAISRAEMAEKAKSAIEDQLRKWREQKQRRKASEMVLREISAESILNQLLPSTTKQQHILHCTKFLT